MKLSYLIRGLPGHPLHPPLTDATIGAYTAVTVMAVASVRVLNLVDEPPTRAASPVPHSEKQEAEA